jgi:Cu/Ag efflux protein CusF
MSIRSTAVITASADSRAFGKLSALVLVAVLGALAPWFAIAAVDAAPAAQSVPVRSYTEGDIKRFDVQQDKVTIKHGPIDNLGMPGMTMVFRVDAALMSKFKAGDLVKFKADRVDGALRVTELIPR